MKFVCFDTATDVLACALWADGAVLEHHETAPRGHADRLLSVVERLLGEAEIARSDLDAVGFGRGPGSFTGLRVAAGVAQGLAFALDLPTVPVSTLTTIAQGSLRETGAQRTLVLLDARLGEVYAGATRSDAGGIMRPIRDERLCLPEDLGGELGTEIGWAGCGPGWEVCTDALRAGLGDRLGRLEPDRLPRACDLATLVRAGWSEGLRSAAEEAFPVYLRRQVVQGAGPAGRT